MTLPHFVSCLFLVGLGYLPVCPDLFLHYKVGQLYSSPDDSLLIDNRKTLSFKELTGCDACLNKEAPESKGSRFILNLPKNGSPDTASLVVVMAV